MPSEQNKSIVRRYLEDVWGRGQINHMREFLSPDIKDNNPGPGQPCGLEGQEWAARGFLGAVSNVSLTVNNLVGDGDRVFDTWTFSATHTGEMFNMPATGKRFSITGADESRIMNGKIVEIWHHEDMLSMMQQLGLAPTPPLPQSFGHRSTGGTTRATGTTNPPRARLEERIREGFRVLIDRGDLDRTGEFLTPDFSGHYSAFPPVYGIDGFRDFLSIYTNGLSNRHAEIEEILFDGDRAAVRVTYHGKNTGSMMGMPATGKTVAIRALTIFRMVGDLVAEQWANNDDMGMMQQLGVMPEFAGAAQPVPC